MQWLIVALRYVAWQLTPFQSLLLLEVLRDAWGQPWALDPSSDVLQQMGAQHWHASFEQRTEQRGGGAPWSCCGNTGEQKHSIQVPKKTKEEGLVSSQDYEMICEQKMNPKNELFCCKFILPPDCFSPS